MSKLNKKIRRTNRKVKNLNRRIGGLGEGEDNKRSRLVAKRDAVQKRRNRFVETRTQNQMSDPNKILRGKNLRRAANSAERLISVPQIRNKKNEIGQIKRGTERDIGRLDAMGKRLEGNFQGLRGNMENYGREAYARSQESGNALRQNLARNAQQATDQTNQLQSSVLGGQISALQNQNIDPSSSGSANIMGQFAQAQQDASAQNASSWQQLGEAMSQASLDNTAAGTTASLNTLNNQAIDAQRNIVNRVSDRQYLGAESLTKARSELGTLRGLRGAERMNQLMKLRGTERDQMNESQRLATERYIANTQASAKQRELAIKGFDAETKRMGVNTRAGGGSGGGSGDGDSTNLSRQDFRGYLSIAEDQRKGGKITDWGSFLKELNKTKGVNMSATQRRQFKRRYRKWLAKKGKK
jgi:hypothetical protein